MLARERLGELAVAASSITVVGPLAQRERMRSVSAIAATLKHAIACLLAEPTGDSYKPDQFFNAICRYLRALGQIRNGQQLLDEYGNLVRRHTEFGTQYSQAWRRGVRQILKLRISGRFIPSRRLQVQSRHKPGQESREELLNPVIRLWRTPRQKSWVPELENDRDQIDKLLSELSCERVRIRKVLVKYNLLNDPRWGSEQEWSEYGAKQDLKAWWSATKDIVCDAQNYHTDGCRFLLGMQRRGLDASETAAVRSRELGRWQAEEIKAAATFIVDQLKHGKGRKEKASSNAARRGNADNDKLLLITALLKHHKLDDFFAGHKNANQAINWTPASSKDLERLTGFNQSKVSRVMGVIFGSRPMNFYKKVCQEKTLEGFVRRDFDHPASRDVEVPHYRPQHPTDDEGRRAVND